MSEKQSDLTNVQYRYDLVAATTQAAINATLKEFLAKFDGKEFVSVYVWEPDDSPEGGRNLPGNSADLKRQAGMDIFDIPNSADQTADEKAAAQKVFDANFSFGFKARLGLPDFPLSKIPDVVVLDQGSIQVTYNLFFASFVILDVSIHRGGYSWVRLDQADQAGPWVFQFTVKLDMSIDETGGTFDKLPPKVQVKLRNLNPDSLFSVQQLYLDLNSVDLMSRPTIRGLEPTSTAYTYLNRVFVNSYFKTLSDESKDGINADGNFLLGYSVKPHKPSKTVSSLTPTSFNFMISQNYDESGKPTRDYDVYTLCYLVMSEGRHLPAAVPFAWNWIDKAQEADFHGTMAIRKGCFATFLSALMSPALRNECLVPSVSFDVNFIRAQFKSSFSPTPLGQQYRIVNDSSSRILTFSWSKSSSAHDTFVPNWGDFTLKYTLQSDIYLEGNILKSVTTGTAWAHINVDGGVTEGSWSRFTTTTSYELGVTASGELMVVMAPGSPHVQDRSEKPSPNFWSKLVTAGEIDGVVAKMKNSMAGLKNFLTGHDRQILAMLNGSHAWIFPGGKTFVFKDVGFSDHQDLIAHVTYADPE
jgi:hypothetical protein